MTLPRLLAAALAALCLTTPVSAGAAVASGPPAPVGAAHWYLTVVYRGHRTVEGYVDPRSERLVLVSPAGETRTVLRQRVSPRRSGFTLEDWSADGSTALLSDGSGKHQRAIRVDVATGATQVTPIPGVPESMLLAPDGRGVVAAVFEGPTGPPYDLEEIDWSGVVTDFGLDTVGPLLAGPADTLVTGAKTIHRHVMRVVSLTSGTVLHAFRTSAPCTPVRWWDDEHVLARCGRYLHLVDAMTGAETALTTKKDVVHQPGSIDAGHVDARRIGSGLYVQVVGACGTTYVTHRAHGSLQPLRIPGSVGNVVMLDAVGQDLVVSHLEDCDGHFPRPVLSRYDPVTQQETPLLELAANEGFGQLLVHGEAHASVS